MLNSFQYLYKIKSHLMMKNPEIIDSTESNKLRMTPNFVKS